MKLIIAVVSKDDGAHVMDALRAAGFYSTKLSTTGGLLQTGNTTLLIGTEQVDDCLAIIKEESKTRTEIMSGGVLDEFTGYPKQGMPTEYQVGGAAIFVLDVEQFIKM